MQQLGVVVGGSPGEVEEKRKAKNSYGEASWINMAQEDVFLSYYVSHVAVDSRSQHSRAADGCLCLCRWWKL
jgi:hypothetical protein